MPKAKPGYIFVECCNCGLVEIKYYSKRRWKMKCPTCGKILDVKYNY